METKAPRILVTGAAGLIGSHLAEYLLNKGMYEVFGVDDLSGGYADFVDKRLMERGAFLEADLTDQKAVEDVFAKIKPDYVYHLAAYAAEGLSPFIRNFNYTNNLISSVNVINACVRHGAKKIIFTSSMAVYGHSEPPFVETQKPEPADPYGIAKYAVEMDLKQAHEQFGLAYSIVRPHNVLGVRQNIWDKYRNVIGIWIRRVLAGETICIYGDGTQKRAFSNVAYCMEPFEKLMTTGDSDVFNIGADREYDLNAIAALVQKVGDENGLHSEIEHLEARLEVKNAYSSHDKAKQILGFEDKTDIEATIREMFAWAKTQPAREIKSMQYEIDKGMYSFWK